MTLDIRLPIGLLFALLGLLLAGYGLSAAPSPAAAPAGINVDAAWGGVLALFGVAMLALWLRGRRRARRPA